MGNKGFRKLVDDDGKEYVFSSEKFNDVISTYQNKLQVKNGYKVSKLSIYEDFSNKLYIPVETINKFFCFQQDSVQRVSNSFRGA